MLAKQAFEANRAEIVLAERFDIFCLVDLAFRVHGSPRHAINRFNVSNVDSFVGLDYTSIFVIRRPITAKCTYQSILDVQISDSRFLASFSKFLIFIINKLATVCSIR